MKIRIREIDQTNFQVEITKKAPELRNINNYVEWQTFVKAKCAPRRLQDVFKTSSRRLPRRLQDVFKTCLQDVLQLCLQDVFKTSWKTKRCYTEEVFKTSSVRLTKANVYWAISLIHHLLDWVIRLFFQIQNFQLLILCMGGQKFLPIWIMFFYVFFYNIIKMNRFCIVLLYCCI